MCLTGIRKEGERVFPYLILLHHGNGPLEGIGPIFGGIIGVLLLDSCELVVGTTHFYETIAKLRVVIKVLAMSDHGTAHDSGGYAFFANEVVTVGKPLDVRIHGGL